MTINHERFTTYKTLPPVRRTPTTSHHGYAGVCFHVYKSLIEVLIRYKNCFSINDFFALIGTALGIPSPVALARITVRTLRNSSCIRPVIFAIFIISVSLISPLSLQVRQIGVSKFDTK